MHTSLQLLLEQLLLAQEASGAPLRRYLRPGAPESEVRVRLESLGLTAPADLVALYGWHDGIDQSAWEADGSDLILDFFPYATFKPLGRAVADYVELKDAWQKTPMYERYLAGSDPGFGYWRSEWFPLFESDRWRHAIDCAGHVHPPIWHVYFEPAPPTAVCHDSLEEFLTELIKAFEAGACYWDQRAGYFQSKVDYDL
jgi:cell wall assembly regulator SMI1